MKNKILSIIVIMILMICLIAQIVNAASLTVTMKPSSSSVKESSEFTVKVSVSNLDVGDNGINSLVGYLEYDDVFEDIDESNIEGLNKWSATFDEETGKIELKKNTFVKTSQDVFQIVVKTKSGVSGKNGAISLTNIEASNSEEKISASDISVSISVTEGSENSNTSSNNSTVSIVANTNSNENVGNSTNNSSRNNTTNNTNNTSTNNTSNNTSNNSSYNNSSTNGVVNNVTANGSSNYTNTTSKEDMPKTGASDTAITLLLIMIVVSLIFYIKFEKINKEIK